MKETKVSQATIVRTVLLCVAIVNSALALFGKSPLPFDDVEIEEMISFIFTAVMAVIGWWKNNSFTEHAIKADAVMRQLKERKKN